MKILSLESSAGVASVALCEDEKLLYLSQDLSGHTHSETLLPTVVSALDRHGLTPKDIDLFVCTVGPGSYTGIRIGVATVKGLASGSGKPCVGVSSLEALAYNCSCFDGLICPVIDARRDQMYSAVFKAEKGTLTRLTEDELLPLPLLDKRLKEYGRVTYLVGDGYEKSAEKLTFTKLKETPVLLRAQNACSAARAGLAKYKSSPEKNYDESVLLPVYLRATQAERERIEREKTKNKK